MHNTLFDSRLKERALLWIHIFVIAISALLVTLITYDTLNNVSFITNSFYLRAQFWICLSLIIAIIAEILIKRHFTPMQWVANVFFLLICVPWTNIFVLFNMQVSPALQYVVRFIPMVRAAYALSIVTGAMTKNWIKGLFFSYLMILLFTVYFGSLMFYIEEHVVNSAITDYWTALYWTCMDVTTCGCAINAMTPTGKVLAVILAGEGLMLFPVFTVYVTDAVTHKGDNTVAVEKPSETSSADA